MLDRPYPHAMIAFLKPLLCFTYLASGSPTMGHRPRQFLVPLLVSLLLLASGCASTFDRYSVDEATIEEHLAQQIRLFDQQQARNDMPLRLELQRAKVTLGPEGREVAMVDFSGRATVDAMMMKIPVGISFRIEGVPVYDHDSKAVFLRELKLLESRVDSGMGSFDLQPVAGTLTSVATLFLDKYPVYEVNEGTFGNSMIGMMNMSIRVSEGRLTMVPGGRRQQEGPVR
ncbi:MAG: DUF1439 domain-containing protein [Halomonadaceae bacterium]|nr:MAG: DUF1439 domain-containing protein [Halomonadaceae bacterium]